MRLISGIKCALSSRVKSEHSISSPERIADIVKAYLDQRADQLEPAGDGARSGRRFAWCGDVLDFLTDGIEDHVTEQGFTFRGSYPGPLRLWDEDQQPDGEHARRFWAVAFECKTGRPVANVCTVFFHRHDRVALPRAPLVLAVAIESMVDQEPLA